MIGKVWAVLFVGAGVVVAILPFRVTASLGLDGDVDVPCRAPVLSATASGRRTVRVDGEGGYAFPRGTDAWCVMAARRRLLGAAILVTAPAAAAVLVARRPGAARGRSRGGDGAREAGP